MCKAKTASGQANRINDIHKEQLQIEDELKRLEYEYPENEELQKYIKLLNKSADLLEEETTIIKEMLPETMEKEECKVIEAGNIRVTFVAATITRSIPVAEFTKDFGPETPEYKKYVKESKKSSYVKVTEIKEPKKKTKKKKLVD